MPDESPEALAKQREARRLAQYLCKEKDCKNPRQPGSSRCFQHSKDFAL